MRTCTNCGAQFADDELFCPKCGQEVQLVPDFETIESTMAQSAREKEELERKLEEERRFQEQQENLRKKRRKKLLLTFGVITAIVIVITVAVVFAIRNRTVNTFDYQFAQAKACYENEDYEEALDHLQKACSLNPDDLDAQYLLAEVEVQLGETDQAAEVLESLLDQDPEREEAYDLLFQIYQDKSEPEKIQARLKKCSNQEVLEKYARFNPQPPTISPEGNTFNDAVKVTMTADGTGEIHYTTDGSQPDRDSKLYTGSLNLTSEGTFTIQAVFVTADGLVSEAAEEEYTISFDVPDAPVITPSSGTYKKMETESEDGTADTSDNVSSDSEEDTVQMITVRVPSGYTCYYSWDKKPDKSSKKYTGPVEMKLGDHVFYAVLCSKQGKLGKVASCTYIYSKVTPTPVWTPTYSPTYEETEPQSAETVATPTPAAEPSVSPTTSASHAATPTPTSAPSSSDTAEESDSSAS